MITSGLQPALARFTYRLCAFVILFSFTFYVAAQFQGAANTFTAVFAFDFVAALLLGVAVVVAYTLFGGFWAVSLTDALQAGLMLVAAILLPLMVLQAADGLEGWRQGPTGTRWVLRQAGMPLVYCWVWPASALVPSDSRICSIELWRWLSPDRSSWPGGLR